MHTIKRTWSFKVSVLPSSICCTSLTEILLEPSLNGCGSQQIKAQLCCSIAVTQLNPEDWNQRALLHAARCSKQILGFVHEYLNPVENGSNGLRKDSRTIA